MKEAHQFDAEGGMGSVSLPTGSDPFSAHDVVPGLTLLADLPVSGALSLSGNLGYSGWLPDVPDQRSLILTPTLALPKETPLALFLGYAGFFSHGGDQHFLEGGVTWLRRQDLQLDLNWGVETDSGDYFLGMGAAVRLGS